VRRVRAVGSGLNSSDGDTDRGVVFDVAGDEASHVGVARGQELGAHAVEFAGTLLGAVKREGLDLRAIDEGSWICGHKF
jgi:hypothetical protein